MESSKIGSILILISSLVISADLHSKNHPEREFWEKVGRRELEAALSRRGRSGDEGLARNVILFVGDGMGPNTVTASRIYKGGEEAQLSFETFPNLALIKTYSVDRQVSESAGTATAMFTGVKSNSDMVGLSSRVKLNDCQGSLHPEARLDTIITWAQRANKKTGFVTTTRVTHATPSALYAHCPNRKWECQAPAGCHDIGYQLVHQLPGSDINVVLGGGRQSLVSNSEGREGDPLDSWSCRRMDGLDLVQDWSRDKEDRNLTHAFVNTTASLSQVDSDQTDYLLGVFANSHLSFDSVRDKGANGVPSLQQMTLKALQILSRNDNGFLLVVEGGLIDLAHHRGGARRALEETLSLDRTVEDSLGFLAEKGLLGETLVIVTSDHAHTLSINGNPPRGNDILGVAGKSKEDGVSYTTLSYGTGGPPNYHYSVSADGRSVVREDPSTLDTTSHEYKQQAAILTDENTHGGCDVALYATGPGSDLFYRVHEQNYIGWAIGYAARIGEFSSEGFISRGTGVLPSWALIVGLVSAWAWPLFNL